MSTQPNSQGVIRSLSQVKRGDEVVREQVHSRRPVNFYIGARGRLTETALEPLALGNPRFPTFAAV